jgi:hypothetical protein
MEYIHVKAISLSTIVLFLKENVKGRKNAGNNPL